MKKFILIFFISATLGFIVPWQANKKAISMVDKGSESLVFVAESKDIEPPLIVEDDIIKKDVVIDKVKPVVKVKKDLNAITAEAYMVANLETGKVYLENNSKKVFPIASLSKFFTAVVARHLMNGNNSITITQSMLDTYGDAGHLVLGEKFTVDELIFPLLLESSNDAAEALAQSYDYKKFIQTMNSMAKEWGMANTSFKDASGLSPSNISNVKDLFVLATYYYNNEKNLLEITKMKEFALATTTDHEYHKFININPFVVYQPFIGGKTGRTQEAKESMISLFNMKVAENTYPIAVIILRSDIGDREMDTERILDRASKVIN